jgi:hypothetical protein
MSLNEYRYYYNDLYSDFTDLMVHINRLKRDKLLCLQDTNLMNKLKLSRYIEDTSVGELSGCLEVVKALYEEMQEKRLFTADNKITLDEQIAYGFVMRFVNDLDEFRQMYQSMNVSMILK